MFRIEIFVKDNKLAEVLKILDGVAYDLKVQPVKNGSSSGPVGQESIADRIRAQIAQEAGKFTAADIAQRVGTSPSNVRSTVKDLIRDKTVRRVERGVFANKGHQA